MTWLGHACTLVELDGIRILTDPVLTGQVGPLRNTVPRQVRDDVADPDVVLVSHVHHDHLHLPSLRRLPRDTRVIVPSGAGRVLGKTPRWDVEELGVGDETQVGTTTVRATYAAHIAIRGRRGPAVLAIGYLLQGHRTVYFAGDTDLFQEMQDLAVGLDLALVPVGGWGLKLGRGHMDPKKAAEALVLLRPRVAVPIHWRTLRLPMAWRTRPVLFTEPGREFVRQAARRAPEVDVQLPEPGQPLEVG